MIEKHVETKALENGLKLDIYDKSRAVASDTWLVTVVFKVEIPVTGELLQAVEGAPDLSDLIDTIGESVLFEVTKERNFINETQKEAMFEALKEDYLKTTLPYLANPRFGARFVLKKYIERMKYKG